jgi:hypothetical protein
MFRHERRGKSHDSKRTHECNPRRKDAYLQTTVYRTPVCAGVCFAGLAIVLGAMLSAAQAAPLG